jgi:hypothetical protein
MAGGMIETATMSDNPRMRSVLFIFSSFLLFGFWQRFCSGTVG